MVKYKLIKEYPNSPDLGIEVETNKHDFLSFIPGEDAFVGIFPANHPEFWEKIEEIKDYNILTITPSNKNVVYEPLEKIVKYNNDINDCWQIHSVKRLSDDVIFTLGDRIEAESKGVITKFEIDSSALTGMLVYGDTDIVNGYNNCCLSYINHCKKPVFITEDGVEVYEKDSFWCININDFNYWESVCKEKTEMNKYYRSFSTEKAALNYIKCNKPILSYNDVSKIMIDYNGDFTFRKYFKPVLMKLVKSKL